ncbi:MAG: hypothetical protein Q9P01_19925 [Anaerolineae bacterium]|nr:hypothetical protein [Anaerolineae bacterium]
MLNGGEGSHYANDCDGQEVTVPAGETVPEAAKQAVLISGDQSS